MNMEANRMKKILKTIVDVFPASFRSYIYFIVNNRYFPKRKTPETFNEKMFSRKFAWNDSQFSTYSDKLNVKKIITSCVGEEYVIPTVWQGNSINPEDVRGILLEWSEIFLKANHNSGPVFLVTKNTPDETIRSICKDLNRQVQVDYGKKKLETWYSSIPREIFAEVSLTALEGVGKSEILDYKFHVFKQADSTQTAFLHVDFDRHSNHNRSFFDEDLTWIPFSTLYPTIRTKIEPPKNYTLMLDMAKKIASEFQYARVDLYNIRGRIYFGEVTFAHGSSNERFTTYGHDKWLGKHWKPDKNGYF